MIRATAGAAVGGVKNIAIDKANKMMKPGEKIQDEYENTADMEKDICIWL